VLMAACGPAATTSTSQTTATTTQTTQTTTQVSSMTTTKTNPVTTQADEKPKYGGTLVTSLISDVTTFAGIENC
jgi:hypothetical protein